jgi:DNA-binding MarR family transcriptional regulator
MTAREEKTDLFVSAMFNLVNAIKNESDQCCKICGGVNEKELMVLVFVGQNKNVKMSDIAETLAAPLSTLTSIVDKLVANKFLNRFNSAEDRRVVLVTLGEKGRESYKQFLIQKQVMAKKVLTKFSKQEQTALIEYINKLAASIV